VKKLKKGISWDLEKVGKKYLIFWGQFDLKEEEKKMKMKYKKMCATHDNESKKISCIAQE
jgi:hypothetical protein